FAPLAHFLVALARGGDLLLGHRRPCDSLLLSAATAASSTLLALAACRTFALPSGTTRSAALWRPSGDTLGVVGHQLAFAESDVHVSLEDLVDIRDRAEAISDRADLDSVDLRIRSRQGACHRQAGERNLSHISSGVEHRFLLRSGSSPYGL